MIGGRTRCLHVHMQANFDLKAAMVRRRALKVAKRPGKEPGA